MAAMKLSVAAAGVLSLAMLGVAVPAAAQNEAVFRSQFEGKRVTVKIDMPATSDGVDLKVGTPAPLDSRLYGNRVRSTGVAIHAGQPAVVTLVRVKKDIIEFQLGGGGFGYDSGSVYIPSVEKSNREKDLEARIKTETDLVRKRVLQRELDDLVTVRNRENARINREKAQLKEANKARIAVERLTKGSRFNLRFNKEIPEGFTPNDMMAALAEYVDFAPPASPRIDAAPPMPAPAPSASGMPRKGMLRADAEREFGRPAETTDRREGALTVTTLVFLRGEQRISAEFVEGVLIKYTIASK
jgi:hypothetical protein